MRWRFYFPFFVFTGIGLFSMFFAGFFLAKPEKARLQHSLLKQSVKSQSLSLSILLNKKKNFLIAEAQKIQKERKIGKNSPFFALLISHSSRKERAYIAGDFWPSHFPEQIEEKASQKMKNSKRRAKKLKKRKAFLIQKTRAFVSQNHLDSLTESPPPDFPFYFGTIKREELKAPIAFFAYSISEGELKMAFLRPDKSFFVLPKGFSAINAKGQYLFHSNSSQIFKIIPKKSPLRDYLKPNSKKSSSNGRLYLFSKKTGDLHQLKKWEEGNLFLVVKKQAPSILWLEERRAFKAFFICFALVCLSLVLSCFKLFPLVSAYQFLKKAFLSFSSERIFPSAQSLKNPWLYFYNNRRPFLKVEAEADVNRDDLSFQDLIQREWDRLKLKFPQIESKEDFDFDIKLFGFEKFLRLIIRELLKNAIEAMGGMERPKIDLSLKKDGEHVLFSVRDYGRGVPDGDYDKLFRLYYSTKNQVGTGLNLAQSLIQANEGEIFFSSPEGGGLKIGFRLPLKGFLKNRY